ncbi:sulfonate ABC transporter permease, partial [Burkholderia contaminans]
MRRLRRSRTVVPEIQVGVVSCRRGPARPARGSACTHGAPRLRAIVSQSNYRTRALCHESTSTAGFVRPYRGGRLMDVGFFNPNRTANASA